MLVPHPACPTSQQHCSTHLHKILSQLQDKCFDKISISLGGGGSQSKGQLACSYQQPTDGLVYVDWRINLWDILYILDQTPPSE